MAPLKTIPRNRILRVDSVVCQVALVGCTAIETLMSNDMVKANAGVDRLLVNLEQYCLKAEINFDTVTLRRIFDDKFVCTFGTGVPVELEGFSK